MSAISPSFADGILVCPTGGGNVVGVDIAAQSLLWGYRYGRHRAIRGRSVAFAGGGADSNGQQTSRWSDATATIAEGHVVITPVESDSLYCLNLADGALAWDPLPQQDGPLRGQHLSWQDRSGRPARGAHRPSCRRRSGLGRANHRVFRRRHPQWPWIRQWQSVLCPPQQRGSHGDRSGRRQGRPSLQVAGRLCARKPGLPRRKGDLPRLGWCTRFSARRTPSARRSAAA